MIYEYNVRIRVIVLIGWHALGLYNRADLVFRG